MKEHPINSLMEIAMNNIKDMIDVNTIIGETIYINENISIIPISKVSFGFVAGGSGAGVKITPVSFVVINNQNIKLIPVEYCSSVDKIVDFIPEVFNKIENIMKCKKEEKTTGQNFSYTYNKTNIEDDE